MTSIYEGPTVAATYNFAEKMSVISISKNKNNNSLLCSLDI